MTLNDEPEADSAEAEAEAAFAFPSQLLVIPDAASPGVYTAFETPGEAAEFDRSNPLRVGVYKFSHYATIVTTSIVHPVSP